MDVHSSLENLDWCVFTLEVNKGFEAWPASTCIYLECEINTEFQCLYSNPLSLDLVD